MIYENAVARERSTKEFCEIAAAVISPSYSTVASFFRQMIGYRNPT